MKSKNPIHPSHRERLLDLRTNTLVPRQGRLDLTTAEDHPRTVRARLMRQHFRQSSDDPDSWIHRQLQRRVQRMRDRGDSASDIALSVTR